MTVGDRWMYLDSTVLIDMGNALDGEWIPPEVPNDDAIRRISAARLAMYGCSDRGWTLATSTVAKGEGLRGFARDLIVPLLVEIDEFQGGPDEEAVKKLAEAYEAAGLHTKDARHAAECAARPWFSHFVTNDKRVLKLAPTVPVLHNLQFVTVQEAEILLDIRLGEPPCGGPAESNPLSLLTPWWIPQE